MILTIFIGCETIQLLILPKLGTWSQHAQMVWVPTSLVALGYTTNIIYYYLVIRIYYYSPRRYLEPAFLRLLNWLYRYRTARQFTIINRNVSAFYVKYWIVYRLIRKTNSYIPLLQGISSDRVRLFHTLCQHCLHSIHSLIRHILSESLLLL